MNRSLIRLVTTNLFECLKRRLPPAGQPPLMYLEAQFRIITDAVPADSVADGELVAPRLDKAKVDGVIEWLYASVAASTKGNAWAQLATHTLRVLSLEVSDDVLALIAAPRKSLDSRTELESVNTNHE